MKSSLFRLPFEIIATGFVAMTTALETMQAVVETVTNQKRPEPLKAPPVDGPPDVDTAVADFANRLAAIVRFTPWDSSELGPASQAILEAARQSFRYVDLRDPRNDVRLKFENFETDGKWFSRDVASVTCEKRETE